MKKRYIFIIISIIMTIAYFDLIDTCEHIDKIISEFVSVDNNAQSTFSNNLFSKFTPKIGK